MEPSDPNFTPQQLEILQLLAQGENIASASRAAAIHRTTIYHWSKHNPAFREAVESFREDARDQRRERTISAGEFALDFALATIINDRVPHNVRLGAAFSLLRLKVVQNDLAPKPEQAPDAAPDSTLSTLVVSERDEQPARTASA